MVESSPVTIAEPMQYMEFDEATQQLLEKSFSESLRMWMGLTFSQSLKVDLSELPGAYVPILFDSHFVADSNVLVAPFLGFGRTSGRDFWVQRGFFDENGIWEESWTSGRCEETQQWGPRTKIFFCSTATEERLEGLLERRDSGYSEILHIGNQEIEEKRDKDNGFS